MNFSRQAQEAAGVFSRQEDSPPYGDPNYHPVRQMLKCPTGNREDVLLNHPHVEGIILVNDGILQVIRIPKRTYDLTADPGMRSPFIAGFIGDHCQTTSLVTIPFSRIFQSFQVVFEKWPLDPKVFFYDVFLTTTISLIQVIHSINTYTKSL